MPGRASFSSFCCCTLHHGMRGDINNSSLLFTLCYGCAGHPQIGYLADLYYTIAASIQALNIEVCVKRIAAAVARAEALPFSALQQAHPRERFLEDMRLERPELIVGCWASR